MHSEYTRWGGAPGTGAMPIVPYQSEAQLAGIIAFLETIDIGVANPHTWVLEDGGLIDGGRLVPLPEFPSVDCDVSPAFCTFVPEPDGEPDPGIYYIKSGSLKYDTVALSVGIIYTF